MEKLKLFAWGAASGAVVLSLFMFTSGIVVLGSTARETATANYNRAVVDNLAPICVAQFVAAHDSAEVHAGFGDLSTTERETLVAERGWATMPGRDRPDDRIVDDCARDIARMTL